ncbi:MAG: DUF21 domain-containing protein [Candidatus Omnitrophica bacterium]|nr:DUF21 domain-containing protein [Candidatus Omnitrophota bacterium]
MITIYTLTVLISLFLMAFFTASEMACTSVNRIRIKAMSEEGNKRAERLAKFLGNEGLFLGTTLVGTNIMTVVSSALATRIFTEYFDPSLAPALATALMVPVTLIAGEVVPKMIAGHYSTGFAMSAVVPLTSFLRILRPVIFLVNSIAKILLFPFRGQRESWDTNFSKTDLKKILLTGHEFGEVEADEVELIHKVLDFGGKTVEKIMIPLYMVSSLNENEKGDDLKRLVSLTGYSRIPVYSGNKRNIVGIANIYDLLFNGEEDRESVPVKKFMREVVDVRSDDGLDIALARLRHRKQPMGVVTGTDGRIVGIITIEDMLEEIVGEIEDR